MIPELKSPIKSYPGSKQNSGLYQRIISLMPEHDIYIEPFLGSGKILCLKKPAAINIGSDIDGKVLHSWNELHCSIDKFLFLNFSYDIVIDNYNASDKKVLIYCDPPYVKSSRKSSRDIYNFEWTDQDHARFLAKMRSLQCFVIISGYRNDLYNSLLKTWNSFDFKTATRGGPATETVWYNFPDPTVIHDSQYLGKNFTDRQRIKRKVNRWVGKLKSLPILEQNLIMDKLIQSRK